MALKSDKPLVWLKGEVKTPPFGEKARIEAGFLLRRLQQGDTLSLPQSRPRPHPQACSIPAESDWPTIWK